MPTAKQTLKPARSVVRSAAIIGELAFAARISRRLLAVQLRITPQAFDAFYAIADQNNWTVGATVENALAALQEKLRDK